MTSNHKRSLLHYASWAVVAALAAPAAAQDQSAAQTSGATGFGQLEEVVVSATRRESNLQTTAISVSALSNSMIEMAAPNDIGDLAVFVPNFDAAKITGYNAASFAIRGVGQTNISDYSEPPVVVMVDDFVYNSIQTQLLDTFDIEQVEVMRGPQGTLFGKNSTGGAVVVKTIKPQLDTFSGKAAATIGSYGTRDIKGAINIPVIEDKLAVRLVGAYNYNKGYMRNGHPYGPLTNVVDPDFLGVSGEGDGAREGGDNAFAGRAKVLWQATDRFSVLFQYEILRDKTEAPAAVDETPAGDMSFLWNILGITQQVDDPLKAGGFSRKPDQYVSGGRAYIDADGVHLNMNLDTDFGTFTSVSGYRKQDWFNASSVSGHGALVGADGDRLSLFDVANNHVRKTAQQELRFTSDFSGPFNFVSGVFYQYDTISYCVSQSAGFLDLVGSSTPFGRHNDNAHVLCNGQKTRSVAAYIEGTYDITDRLKATGGFRYTWDRKRWQGRQQAYVQDILNDPNATWQDIDLLELANFDRFPAGVVTLREKWDDPSYRFILSYEASDDIFAYASYSRGFKAGGYNTQIGTFAPFGNNLDAFAAAAFPTDPEKADSYEIGVKTQFFDNRVRFNLTGFWVDYNDLQKQINVPLVVNGQPFQVSTFFNAAKARVKGIELELTALPIENLIIRGNLGFQDGGYREFQTPVPAGYDLSTAPLDRTPKWSWGLDGTYTVQAPGGFVDFNANVNYSSRSLYTQSLIAESANSFLNKRLLGNASVTYRTEDDKYYIRGIVRNIGDKRYRVSSQTVAGLWLWSVYGPPRYYAAEIGFNF